MSGSAVWNRGEEVSPWPPGSDTRPEVLPRQLYMLGITATTVVGLMFSAFMASVSYDWDAGGAMWLLFIPALGSVFVVQTGLEKRHGGIGMSLFGYAMLSGSFGLLMGPILAMYTGYSVFQTFVATIGVTVVAGTVGATTPRDLSHWWKGLITGLLVLIGFLLIAIVSSVFGAEFSDRVMFYVAIPASLLFAALLAYDFNRAVRLDYTVKNVIDCSVAIYLDILNLFLWLLRIFGVKVKD